jgi:hypothetical protein
MASWQREEIGLVISFYFLPAKGCSSIETTISFGLWQGPKHKSRWARVLAFLDAITAIKFK